MLIITGTIAYDYIMDFPGKFSEHILPEQIHNINLSFIVNKFDKRRGGTAGNVSYTLGLLETKNILFSAAGKDFEEYKKAFSNLSSVDLSKVLVDTEKYTATGFAMTDKTNNQIWGYFYGAAESISDLTIDNLVGSNDLVLIGPSGAKGSMGLLRQCVEKKSSYMFDPGFILTQVNDEDLTFGISHAQYIVGNDYEINLMQQRVQNWKQLIAEKTVITTLGEHGATIQDNGKTYTIGAVIPSAVVDPTGAGDAWRAGFLAGLSRNFDMQVCGQMGSVAASFALEQYGTQEHAFTSPQFADRYHKAYGDIITL